ncbi:MAG: prephenate dehydrogenase/arogenate dehydrogenase family protein [Candidatus Omnitrophica bacterium]|nr:prephenate dehydrogenase/arogenate dehydrogenase family protein [Candidatus Omnitrophota bacterium]
MHFKKVVIIGVGLIGGSIGKALIQRGRADEVVGVCRRRSSLERAIAEKTLTRGFVDDYAKALPGADIIVIATPVHVIRGVLRKIAEVDVAGAVVTDAGSTKRDIVEFAREFKDKFTFIGGHPLAGSEKTGPESARADLFEGSVCLLTPDADVDKSGLDRLKGMWTGIGADVGIISPEEHDRNLAYSSHLPHVVAYALAGVLEEKFPATMFATGFKDTTRIASSDAGLWSDILLSNKDNVLEATAKFREILSRIEEALGRENEEDLKEHLRNYKALRDELF